MTIPSPSPSPAADLSDIGRPRMAEKTISISFKGDKLSRSAGNWKTWSLLIEDDLDVSGLGEHISSDSSSVPDADTHISKTSFLWIALDFLENFFIVFLCFSMGSKQV